ncbi:MAG: hypothetical protein KZQ86_06580 [Candidatus Thiodiazotropha sp. (ex Lucinoma kastoroae)]|nr:hypothetical protein [Candidatus Thiodiazotropha sp. (ex Lucinoma kastoroae)]
MLTTLYSYGEVQPMRQVEIIQKMGMPHDEAVPNINTVELAKALAREMGSQAVG